MNDDPLRLSEGEGELADALRAAREVGPTEEQRAAVAAGLPFLVAPPPAPGAPPAPTASGAAATSAYLKVAAVLLAAGGATIWWRMADVGEPALAAQETPVETREMPEGRSAGPAAELERELAEPVPDRLPERRSTSAPSADEPSRRSRPRRPRSARAAGSVVPPGAGSAARSNEPAEAAEAADDTPDGPNELELLSSARRHLRSAPARALSFANQHRSAFASGAYAEEREVLAIDALARLGRRAEAERRAARFERRWPASVHGARISAILQP
ncbi:MAG: hypothetical protein AAF938_12450 [Myxococcota bacterium]